MDKAGANGAAPHEHVKDVGMGAQVAAHGRRGGPFAREGTTRV